MLLGIPDLRVWPDPYIGLEEDRAKGLMLAAECQGLDFAASLELYYRITDAVPEFQARRFARSLLAAEARSRAVLEDLELRDRTNGACDLLDLGCGTAPLVVAAARHDVRVVGVDIAFRWLVMAQKRLAEAGVEAPLVCACAEALPFRESTFDHIAAESAIEHFRDQRVSLGECSRVLRPHGRLFLSTPNRRSLGPDPHTGVPAGGWLPDAVTAWHMRRRGGIPPRRQLLGQRQLRSLLQDAGFDSVTVDAPIIPAAQGASFGPVTRFGIGAYNLMKRLPAGASALRSIGPLLHAAARKAAVRPAV